MLSARKQPEFVGNQYFVREGMVFIRFMQNGEVVERVFCVPAPHRNDGAPVTGDYAAHWLADACNSKEMLLQEMYPEWYHGVK